MNGGKFGERWGKILKAYGCRPVEIPVEAFRSRLVLFESGTGRVLASTPGATIGPLGNR